MTGPANDALLERWRTERDATALAELLKPYRDKAYATAYRILGHGFDAEDAVQNAFIKLLSRTNGFENTQEFQRSVYRAVVQCALDQLRNRRRGLQRMNTLARKTGKETPSSETDPAEHEETRTLLREALQRLPEEDRVAVVLCCEQSLALGDVALMLNMPRQTLRDRLDRALENLRKDMRRAGVLLSLAMLATLLAQEGALAAPPALCARLDHLTTTHAIKSAAAVSSYVKVGLASAAAITLALVLVLPAYNRKTFTEMAIKSAEAEPGRFTEKQSTPGVGTQNGRPDMDRKSILGITLTTALMAAQVVNAGEKDDVEAVLKEIRALKAEKTAAAEKAHKEAEVQRAKYLEERKENTEIRLGGTAVGGPQLQPGQPATPWNPGTRNPR